MFYLKCQDPNELMALLSHLKQRDILAVFHYVPLHSSPAGRKFGVFHGQDRYTTAESERLVRLPLWYGMDDAMLDRVTDAVRAFYA